MSLPSFNFLPSQRIHDLWPDIPASKWSGPESGQPCSITSFLKERAVEVGAISGDGRCQFAAFSKAAFGTVDYADQLRTCAVQHLRNCEDDYNKFVTTCSYNAHVTQIERGEQWGDDLTLHAMANLTGLEVRVLKNLPVANATACGPRLMKIKIQPRTSRHHQPIYLLLQNEHYSTLENADVDTSQRTTTADGDTASQFSIITDPENDLCHAGEPIRVDGEEYYPGELLSGDASLFDGTKLVMERSPNGDKWVIFRVHRSNGVMWKDEVRSLPRQTIPRKKPSTSVCPALPCAASKKQREGRDSQISSSDLNPHTGTSSSPLYVSSSPASESGDEATDIQPGKRQLPDLNHEHGIFAFASAAHKIMKEYTEQMELVENPKDESMLGRMSNALLPAVEKAQQVVHQLHVASPQAQQTRRILVAGREGSGKSTSINYIIKHTMKQPKCHGPSTNGARLEVIDVLLNEAVDLSCICQAEKEVLKEAKKNKYYNVDDTDILPTGWTSKAVSALVTHVHLIPDAHDVKLKLKYRARDVVDRVQKYAERIRDHFKRPRSENDLPEDMSLSDCEDDLPEDLPEDVPDCALFASWACYLYALPEYEDQDVIERVQKYEGEFALPERFNLLLGCEREFTLKCYFDDKDGEKTLAELSDLLLVHTVGDWSHWAIVEKVDVEIPSKLDAPLHICDVPGFGDEALDPFRQKCVTQALSLPCSTLCICLGPDMRASSQQSAAQRLEEAGIFDDLLCKVATSRRVGKILLLHPLMWIVNNMKATLKKQDKIDWPAKIKETHVTSSKEAKEWLIQKFKARCRDKKIQRDIGSVAKERIQARSIDIKGEQPELQGIECHMRHLVSTLVQNSDCYCHEQQEECLQQLTNDCLVPFCLRLMQMSELRNLKHDQNFRFTAEKSLVSGARDILQQRLSQEVNSRLRDDLDKTIIEPHTKICTAEAVKCRFHEDAEFVHYKRSGSRKLGNDMRSSTPEKTSLPHLAMKPLSRDVIIPLQHGVQSKLNDLVDAPAKLVEEMSMDIIRKELEANKKYVPEQSEALSSLLLNFESRFPRDMQAVVNKYRCKLLQQIDHLRYDLFKLLHRVLVEEDLPHLAQQKNRTKELSMNEWKMEELAGRTEGLRGMAARMRSSWKDHLLKSVLCRFKADFIEEVEAVLSFYAGHVRRALEKSETMWFEELDGFQHSAVCSHRLAKLIETVTRSEKLKHCIALDEPMLQKIVQVGTPDPSKTTVHDLRAAATSTALALAEDEPRGEADATWHCPMCYSTRTEDKGPFKLTLENGICQRKETKHCWCEKMSSTEDVCYLCLRSYNTRHKQRSSKHEKDRLYAKRKRGRL